MISFRVHADVKEDRQVLLTLPPEVPVGTAELIVSVGAESAEAAKPPRSSLADWAETNAEPWGERLSAADVEGFTGRRFPSAAATPPSSPLAYRAPLAR